MPCVNSTQGFFFIKMTRPIFIYFAALLVIAPVVLAFSPISFTHQLGICFPLIVLLGIPHGAIDNVLYMREKKLSLVTFISVYLILVLGNALLWFIKPELAYLGFLFLSAYHFGQSQFSHYLNNKKIINKLTYLCWGISVLSGLIFFNLKEIEAIMSEHQDFITLKSIHDKETIRYLFILSTAFTLGILSFLTGTLQIKKATFFMEMLLLVSIFVSFTLLPLIIGFTFYFVILHSLKVLREEYAYLTFDDHSFGIRKFLNILAPFTLLSVFGIALLFVLIATKVLNFSYGYILLITISSITLPHAFVMNKFYNMLSFRGINSNMTT